MADAARATQVLPECEVAVIGAGPGGICAAVLLKQRGISDFIILERAKAFGGSWRDNSYPGIGVDVPGFTYQYSFARNPKWSRVFPRGAEVLQYHLDVADRFGLTEHTRFGTGVRKEVWDDANGWWTLHLDDGSTLTARFVISAVGAYLNPKDDPGIPGMADFTGTVLRPASWDHSYDLTGKRIAVIGTGASSVQISPAIASKVAHLEVYQRTPVWCLPKPDIAIGKPAQWLLATRGVGAALSVIAHLLVELALRFVYQTPAWLFRPTAGAGDRLARLLYRGYLRVVVRDKTTRAALAPHYGALGKRPTLSNTFLRTFNRDNTELVTAPIETVTADGIRTTDGIHHRTDAIVLATGYELFSDPESYRTGTVVGRDGFDLGEFFAANKLQAYQSVSLPGLPNRWILVGPYSWIGTGWHALVEITSSHAVNVIAEARRRDAPIAEVTLAAHVDYDRMIRRQGANIAYYFTELNKGLRTYYVNSDGDMPYIRPTSLFGAQRASRHVDFAAYRFTQAPLRLVTGTRKRTTTKTARQRGDTTEATR